MDRNQYRFLLENELYYPYATKGGINPAIRFWCKYLRPESNAVYLIRKNQYYGRKKGRIYKAIQKLTELKLLRKYGIYVHPQSDIGTGLRIYHPHGVFITNVKIGDCFTVYQNCTVGVKHTGEVQREICPDIGDNVTMYSGSSIIGSLYVADGTVLASNSCLTKSTEKNGVYGGVPAQLISYQKEN